MRRPARLLSAVVLAMAMLVPTAAVATPAVATEIVMAAEGPASTEGLDPRSADDEDNEFAPADYEANYLWGAAVGLLALVLAIVGGIGGLYWYLVVRPNQPQRA